MEADIVKADREVLRANVEHPIVTNKDFVAQLFSPVRGGDAALPKLLWDFLFNLITNTFNVDTQQFTE